MLPLTIVLKVKRGLEENVLEERESHFPPLFDSKISKLSERRMLIIDINSIIIYKENEFGKNPLLIHLFRSSYTLKMIYVTLNYYNIG